MNKKPHNVRLTHEERFELKRVIRRLEGTSQKVRRAKILLSLDLGGPNRTDERIAARFSCCVDTVARIRGRLVERGFWETLNGAKRKGPRPTERLLTGEQEAKIVAMWLGPAPNGYAEWSTRLLARKVVELEIVESISYETIRRTLKRAGLWTARTNTGMEKTLDAYALPYDHSLPEKVI
jgi:Homeodomain-like domain